MVIQKKKKKILEKKKKKMSKVKKKFIKKLSQREREGNLIQFCGFDSTLLTLSK